jgi:predicted transcriptional regulator
MKTETTNGQVDMVSESPAKPKRAINYPKHIKPLQERIMSAVGNGCRTAKAITTYCGEDRVKVVNMHLGRLLSAGKLVKYTNSSGFTRYYTPDEAKAKGYKPDAQPKKAEKKPAKQSKTKAKGQDYISFLENRVTEWQAESRKQAHEIEDLKAKLSEAQVQLIKARQTRDVTSEVTEVMEEVIKLRATVEYLESKLFGSK